MNTSVHFTMSTSTLFRNIAQQIDRKIRANSTLLLNRRISNKECNESQTLKLSKHLRVRNMNSKSKTISESQTGPTSQRPYTVVVEGNIGSGKTTFLAPFMRDSSNQSNPISDLVEVHEEPVAKWRNLQGTNLLQLMYEDPKRWSLLFQTYVQLTMLQQHTKISTKPIHIMERSLLSARYCFIENLYNGGNMTDPEYAVISEWFNFLITCPQLNFKIDQIIYLRTDPEVAYERIKKRKRPEEHLIPFSYLKDLHDLHEDWLVHQTKFQPLVAPVTIIDCNPELEILSEKYKSVEHQILQQAQIAK